MSIVLLFNQKQADEWFHKLSKLLPNTKIEIYPEIEDYNKVEFLATWKPHENYVNEFPNLKVVQSVGAGIDHLLHTSITDEIQITRIVDPALKQDMFEYVLACIMSSMKNLLPYYKNQIQEKWDPIGYLSVNETVVTVLGLGEIGSLVAEKLAQIGFKVKGWSTSSKKINNVESFYGENQLNEAVENSNFVVNILPLTNDTKEILNEDLFNQFSKNTILINVGRGGHLNENDLLNAIENIQIKEAYLDVFNQEPLTKSHPFWQNESIFITPHIASITNPNTAITQVAENYKRLIAGDVLLNKVDLKRGY